jgi:hypothetical protein
MPPFSRTAGYIVRGKVKTYENLPLDHHGRFSVQG